MPRVVTHKARKDYPASGIKKGDTYYQWATRTTVGKSYVGTIHRSLTPPRPSQLTKSEFLGAIGDLMYDGWDGVEDAEGLRDVATTVRDIGQAEQDKFDNMPEGLQQGDTGQTLEERASQCSEWADAIDAKADELETALNEIQEAEDAHGALAAEWDAYDAACDQDAPAGPEPQAPTEDDPRERDYDNERSEAVSEAVNEAQGESPF